MYRKKLIKAATLLAMLFPASPVCAGAFYVAVTVIDEENKKDEVPVLFFRTTKNKYYNDALTLFWGNSYNSGVPRIIIYEGPIKPDYLEFSFDDRTLSNTQHLLKLSEDEDEQLEERLETIPLTKDGKHLRSLKLTLKGVRAQISDLEYGDAVRN